MSTLALDTDLKAEAVQIALLRQASMEKKMACVRSLSQTVIQLSRRAISRAHPELDAQAIDLLFVSYHYGPDLADCVRRYLDHKGS